MGTHRDIDLLEPKLRRAVQRTLKALKEANFPVLISETLRDDNVQKAYYAQGRKPLDEVNALRKEAGLYLLTEGENKNIITNCDGVKYKSNHQTRDGSGYGYAIDLVPAKENKYGNLTFWWNAPQDVWEKLGAIAEENGLDWVSGGIGENWSFKDNPHFELLKDFVEPIDEFTPKDEEVK